MKKKDWLFYFLCAFGLIMANSILIYEILYGPSWFIIPLELAMVVVVCIEVNLVWDTTLAKILSICFFLGALMLMLIESETMQHLFTKEFLIAELVICINLIVMAILFDWITKPRSIMDHEIVEVTPIEG